MNQTEKILEAILGAGEEDLRTQALERLVRYARCRADWAMMSAEERKEGDAARSRLHNSLIDALNILSRAMAAHGEDNEWRSELGNDRKAIGDFACLAHAILGIRQR